MSLTQLWARTALEYGEMSRKQGREDVLRIVREACDGATADEIESRLREVTTVREGSEVIGFVPEPVEAKSDPSPTAAAQENGARQRASDG